MRPGKRISQLTGAQTVDSTQELTLLLEGDTHQEQVLHDAMKRVAALSQEIPVRLSGRIKSRHSILAKMHRRRLELHEVLDLIGVRAVTGEVDDCYRLAKRIHHSFRSVSREYDDYIATPKPNGYQALHTTVLVSCGTPVELQIRTQAMDERAERGCASHRHYKSYQEGSLLDD